MSLFYDSAIEYDTDQYNYDGGLLLRNITAVLRRPYMKTAIDVDIAETLMGESARHVTLSMKNITAVLRQTYIQTMTNVNLTRTNTMDEKRRTALSGQRGRTILK